MQHGHFHRISSSPISCVKTRSFAIVGVRGHEQGRHAAKHLGFSSTRIVDAQFRKLFTICSSGKVSGSSDEASRDDKDSKPFGLSSGVGNPVDESPTAPHASVPLEDSAGGTRLTLGSEIMERMAKLRALDQYRRLMAELSDIVAARQQPQQRGDRPGVKRTSASTARVGTAATAAAAAAAGDDSSLLLRGSLLIAQHRYPSLEEGKVYSMLDDMARRVTALLPADPSEHYPLRVVAAINRVLYTDYGFRGNEEDYYSADNSCINRVMERRVGIPITLSLVYSEVARRVGLPMRGLNLPGHFMLQPLRPARQHIGTGAAGSGISGSAYGGDSTGGEKTRGDEQQDSRPGRGSNSLPGGSGAALAAAEDAATTAGTSEREGSMEMAAAGFGRADDGVDGPHNADANADDGDGDEDEDADSPLEVLVDAFRSGEVCLPGEAEERISAVVGSPVRIDPRVLKESQPLPPRMFLFRMLSNLRSIYLSTQQVDLLLDVLKFMRVTLQEGELLEEEEGEAGVSGWPSSTLASTSFGESFPLTAAAASLARDEGLCYFALRRYPECLEALREYLQLAEQAGNGPLPPEEAQTMAVVMEEARRRMTQQRQ